MDLEINEQLIRDITRRVLEALGTTAASSPHNTVAPKSTSPKDIVIGIGPAFLTQIKHTLNGLPLVSVLAEIVAGIEEEGMTPRVVKVYKTADVAFIGKEAAALSGSGVSIGIQSKGTTIIHQRDLYPLSNLELFAQAPLLTLTHYRHIGKNAARYAKGEKVTPVAVENDPMIRSAYQVKAALMHIKETEQMNRQSQSVEWNEVSLA